MKKSIKSVFAIVLSLVMLVSPMLVFAEYKPGDTIVWKYRFDDDQSEVHFCKFGGSVTEGYTYFVNLDPDSEYAFFFKAEEAGFYMFNNGAVVSKEIVNGNPEGSMEGQVVYSVSEEFICYDDEFDYDDECNTRKNYDYYFVAYLDAGEEVFIRDYGTNYVMCRDLGPDVDIKVAGNAKLTIEKDIYFYTDDGDISTPTDATSTDAQAKKYQGFIQDNLIAVFGEEEYYVAAADFTSDSPLKAGKNKVTVKLCGFEKEIEIECVDYLRKIENVEILAEPYIIDYLGNYTGDYPDVRVTFSDGTVEVYHDIEVFKIDDEYFYFDSRCGWVFDSEEYKDYYYWFTYLRKCDESEDIILTTYYDEKMMEVEQLSAFENFLVMMSHLRSCLTEAINRLLLFGVIDPIGYFEEKFSYVDLYFYWLINR